MMITNANEILFRSSGLGYILTDTKDKSNSDKYFDAFNLLKKYQKEYDETFNKATKTASNKHQQILKLNTSLLILEKNKDDFQPSDTCRKQLIRVYAQTRGRYEELKNKYLDKGNARENNAITLLSVVLKRFYKKNTIRKYNDFIQGEPDLYIGESIDNADETLDTKCSWSYITFLEALTEALNSIYDWQGQGYMWLTGAKKHSVCYCLVNGTYKYINDQIRSLGWKFGVLDGDISTDEDFIKAVQQLERNHIFDIDEFMKENPEYTPRNNVWYDKEKDLYTWDFDIPKQDRVFIKSFYRDEEKIKRIEKRAVQCRSYMNKTFFKIAS